MSQAGQRLDPTRYTIVPRTLSFLLRGDQVLLLRVPQDRGEWAGRLNGLGGHVESGEDVLRSARREIREEAGLTPGDLRLCGVVHVDTGRVPGIGLYVCVGTVPEDVHLQPGSEGELVWIRLEELPSHPLVDDLPTLLPRALAAFDRHTTFSAAYHYGPDGALEISFAE